MGMLGWAQLLIVCSVGPLTWAVDTFLVHPSTKAADDSADAAAAGRSRGAAKRLKYLDVWRIVCVFAVVLAASDKAFAEMNVVLGQMWILPIASLACGMLFFRSRTHVFSHVVHCLVCLSSGCLLNIFALLVTGNSDEWLGAKFHERVIGHMGFFLMLVCGAVLAYPLKIMDSPMAFPGLPWCCVLWYACLFTAAFSTLAAIWWTQPGKLEGPAALLRPLTWTLVLPLVAVCSLKFSPLWAQGYTIWWLLAIIYLGRIAVQEPSPGLAFHACDLYVLAVVSELRAIRGAPPVGKVIRGAWPFFLCLVSLSLTTRKIGRMDTDSSERVLERLRHYSTEAFFVIAFICIPTAERARSFELDAVSETFLDRAVAWAAAAFLSHQAIYCVLGDSMGLVAVLFLAFPMFFGLEVCERRASRARAGAVGGDVKGGAARVRGSTPAAADAPASDAAAASGGPADAGVEKGKQDIEARLGDTVPVTPEVPAPAGKPPRATVQLATALDSMITAGAASSQTQTTLPMFSKKTELLEGRFSNALRSGRSRSGPGIQDLAPLLASSRASDGHRLEVVDETAALPAPLLPAPPSSLDSTGTLSLPRSSPRSPTASLPRPPLGASLQSEAMPTPTLSARVAPAGVASPGLTSGALSALCESVARKTDEGPNTCTLKSSAAGSVEQTHRKVSLG